MNTWLDRVCNQEYALKRLYEQTVIQLKKDTWKRASRVKSQKLQIKYIGVEKKGYIRFRCSSGTTKGKSYVITLRLKDFEEASNLIIDGRKIKDKEVMQLALSGDIELSCECLDFRYRFAYLSYTKGYGLLKETRYPKVQNRNLQGTTCKHCIAVLNAVPMYLTTLIKDYRKQGLL